MRKPLTFKPVFATDFFNIEASEDNPPGARPYYRMVSRDAVVCCLLNARNELLLVRQFRPNLGAETLEFPAGGVEEGESPLAAMRRELAEETGFSCDLLPLGSFHLMTNRTTHAVHTFLGLGAHPVPDYAPEAGIEVVSMTRSDFVALVLADQFQEIAGLGVLQSASIHLGLDVVTADIEAIHRKFYQSKYQARLK